MLSRLWLTVVLAPSVALASRDSIKEGLRLASEGKSDAALVVLRRAAAEEPSNPSAWVAVGTTALQIQKFDEARQALEQAVALDPRAPTPLYSLAMLYEKLKLFQEARQTWQQFLATQPPSEPADMARRHLERLP